MSNFSRSSFAGGAVEAGFELEAAADDEIGFEDEDEEPAAVDMSDEIGRAHV